MNLDEYQSLALVTSANNLDSKTAIASRALGLTGESGEVADIIKKHIAHGHTLDDEKLSKELGDVLWYIAVLANDLGFKLSDIAEQNITKLKKRYPEGFSSERSINRVE